MPFIVDNILLIQETMAWVEASNQDLIFLKLEFFKAYKKINWHFLFRAIEQFGFFKSFTNKRMLLFSIAKAFVKINGSSSASFWIKRGVRQGCLLTLYLFLIVAKVFNVMVKCEVKFGGVKGIRLPMDDKK